MDEQLYSEILYKTLHFRGCDADLDRFAILEYLQKAFEVDDTKHSHLLEVEKVRKVNVVYTSGIQDLSPAFAVHYTTPSP
jgi:hypothetical protein